MALPSSGQLSIGDIRTELGSTSGSLRTLSAAAGFATPDSISEFYGYSSLSVVFEESRDYHGEGPYTFSGNGTASDPLVLVANSYNYEFDGAEYYTYLSFKTSITLGGPTYQTRVKLVNPPFNFTQIAHYPRIGRTSGVVYSDYRSFICNTEFTSISDRNFSATEATAESEFFILLASWNGGSPCTLSGQSGPPEYHIWIETV